MERNFEFGALFKTHEKKHKNKPVNFISVAGGIQKRLECSIRNRKSTRLTVFDNTRKLPECPSPAPISEAQLKMEHRRQQLEKWKLEKEQKKKEQAAQKKQPFRTGIAPRPLKFELPPPPPKPSMSGRVTRSMARSVIKPAKPSPRTKSAQSFAPKNATFKPPELKNLPKLPKLAPPSKTKVKKDITFEPVIPTTKAVTSRTRLPLTRQNAIDIKSSVRSTTDTKNIRSKGKKPSPKKALQSSSSSDMETARQTNRTRRSIREPKPLTPKVLAMQSSSNDKSSGESSSENPRRKSLRSTNVVHKSVSSSSKASTDTASSDKQSKVKTRVRKSIPKNHVFPVTSSDRFSSDVEFVDEVPAPKSRKSLPATPRNRVPKSESSSEEKLRSPKSPLGLALTPEKIEDAKNTPSVTMSRGKDNARRETIWKIKEGLLDEDASDIDSVEYFRQQLASEAARISDMCCTWDKVLQQSALPEFVQEAILAAVGQGRLLVSQKLQQFGSLVERCARPQPAAALVTPADLRGFWDMVYIQVTNVDLRFKKLEELRQRDWAEDAPLAPPGPAPAARARPRRAPTGGKPAGTSRIQHLIAEKRKAMKAREQVPSNTIPAVEEKSFEAGFFTVRSPVKGPPSPCPAGSPAPRTPCNKHTLLKAVLSSEAKKAACKSPFAMLRASLLAKNVEQEGIAPLPETPKTDSINPFATPGKSILKSTKKSGKKSMKIVLFHGTGDEHSDPFPLVDSEPNSDAFHTARDDGFDNGDKENSPSPVLKTRQSKRLTLTTDAEATPRRSTRKKRADSDAAEDTKKTPSRSSSRKKTKEDTPKEVTQRSTRASRKKTLQNVENNMEEVATPKRSTRKNKVTTIIS